MADMFFNSFKQKIGDGTIDLDSHSFKVCLLTSSYTPDASDVGYSDLSGEVANGNGYTTGGKTLTGVTWSQVGGVGTFDAADLSWDASTFTARYAVIYDDTAAGDPLILLIDFGADRSPFNAPFTLEFNAAGIFTLT